MDIDGDSSPDSRSLQLISIQDLQQIDHTNRIKYAKQSRHVPLLVKSALINNHLKNSINKQQFLNINSTKNFERMFLIDFII